MQMICEKTIECPLTGGYKVYYSSETIKEAIMQIKKETRKEDTLSFIEWWKSEGWVDARHTIVYGYYSPKGYDSISHRNLNHAYSLYIAKKREEREAKEASKDDMLKEYFLSISKKGKN